MAPVPEWLDFVAVAAHGLRISGSLLASSAGHRVLVVQACKTYRVSVCVSEREMEAADGARDRSQLVSTLRFCILCVLRSQPQLPSLAHGALAGSHWPVQAAGDQQLLARQGQPRLLARRVVQVIDAALDGFVDLLHTWQERSQQLHCCAVSSAQLGGPCSSAKLGTATSFQGLLYRYEHCSACSLLQRSRHYSCSRLHGEWHEQRAATATPSSQCDADSIKQAAACLVGLRDEEVHRLEVLLRLRGIQAVLAEPAHDLQVQQLRVSNSTGAERSL